MTGEQLQETMSISYERGDLPFQKGVELAKRSGQVRARLTALFSGTQSNMRFVDIRSSNFEQFTDKSGRPQVVVVERDGYFNMEENVYSTLFDESDDKIVDTFATWEDA